MTTAYFFSYVDNNVSTAQLSCIERARAIYVTNEI
jgi:hypothetical protein